MTEKTLKDLLSSLKTAGKPKTSAYDTQATVTRVENGVAWVHIPGGVTETPVKLTINAQAGDNVQVRVSGGRAFMVGNATAPPTDDHTAKQALAETRTVSKVVKAVKEVAERASKIAGNTNQYFWHTETGTDTGAHITEIPQEDFLADPENGGGNTLIRSNGVAIRDGLNELAQFTKDGVWLGGDGQSSMEVTAGGVRATTTDGSDAFNIVSGGYDGTRSMTCSSDAVVNPNDDKTARWLIRTRHKPPQTPVDNTTETFDVRVRLKATTPNGSLDKYYGGFAISKNYDSEGSHTSVGRQQAITVIFTGSVVGGAELVLTYNTTEAVPGINITSLQVGNISSGISSVEILAYRVVETYEALNPALPSYTLGTRAGSTLGAYSFTTGEGLIASADDQAVVGKYNVEDANGDYAFIVGNGTDDSNRSNAFTVGANGDIEASGAVKANAVQSYTPTWETGQDPVRYHCVVSAGLCSFFFMGAAVAHSSGDLICTLPEGARPSTQVNMPFIKMTGGVVGVLTITTAGAVTVGSISSTTNAGRIYFNCSYPVV